MYLPWRTLRGQLVCQYDVVLRKSEGIRKHKDLALASKCTLGFDLVDIKVVQLVDCTCRLVVL